MSSTILEPDATAADIQLKVPDPSVLSTYPLVPPDICKFPTAPKVTFADVVKLTIPVALLTIRPVNDQVLVIFGCAAVVTVAADPLAFPVNDPINATVDVMLLVVISPLAKITLASKTPFPTE